MEEIRSSEIKSKEREEKWEERFTYRPAITKRAMAMDRSVDDLMISEENRLDKIEALHGGEGGGGGA